jgi:hypothetical protein
MACSCEQERISQNAPKLTYYSRCFDVGNHSIKNLFNANPVYEKAVENNSVSPLERIPMVPRLKAAILAEPVLVGRERELEELMHYLDSAFDGKGTTHKSTVCFYLMSHLDLIQIGMERYENYCTCSA